MDKLAMGSHFYGRPSSDLQSAPLRISLLQGDTVGNSKKGSWCGEFGGGGGPCLIEG